MAPTIIAPSKDVANKSSINGPSSYCCCNGCWALTLWNWVEQYQCLVFIFQRYFNIFQIIYYFIKLIIMFTYKVLFYHLEWLKSLLEIQSIGEGIGDVKLFQFKPQSLCWLLCVGFFPDISLRALSLTPKTIELWALSIIPGFSWEF